MLDPYRMVVVNIIASALVLAGTLFYRFIYPKKKINLLILLLVISILPVISIFRTGAYESGDFNIHIYRIMSFYDSLMEGHLMPSWAGELNATYGNPLFIFNYSLPYYAVSFFHFIGISFISSMKLYLGLTLYFSGIFMYLWIKNLTGNKLAAFTSAIFYVFSPYHLIDVHFRATLGESTIFLLTPLLFLFITKYSNNRKFIYLIFIILSTDLLFLAHPLLAGVFFGLAVLYVLFINAVSKNVRTAALQLLSLSLGLIASVYVWIWFILFSPYMYSFPRYAAISDVSFYPFSELFISPWRYGFLFQGPKGELALIIGYTQIFVLITSILLLLLRKVSKKIRLHLLFWTVLCTFTIFMTSPVSNIFWKYFYTAGSMLNTFGRLSLVLSFLTSIIAGYFAIYLLKNEREKVFVYILIIITIGYTILNWGHRRVIPEINDAVLKKNVWASTITEGVTAYFLNNKWADVNNFWFTKLPKQHLEIIQGSATVRELRRTSVQHDYLIDAQTPITIKENTLYYPGWNFKSNSRVISIYPGKRGVINARLPAGKQYLTLFYKDIPTYALSKTISGISFLTLILTLAIYYLSSFLPIHNISPGKRKIQLGLKIKKGLRNFISHGRK